VPNHYFGFLFNADRTPPVFNHVSPSQATYVDGVDFASMTFSESVAQTTAPIFAADLGLGFTTPAPDGTTSTSGCEAADFNGMPAGSIALTRRGGCNFAVKSANAKAAGAIATVVMNEGNNDSPARQNGFSGTLGSPNQGVAIGLSYPIGVDLANGVNSGDTGSQATIKVDRVQETRTTRNILAETSGGDPNNVIVVGAHLDSVPRGAGVNDNGSGSAAILEIAEQMASQQRDVRNKIRFAWWGAEEFGLLGSRAYVNSLTAAQKDAIALNLNFDMVGSPNFVRFVYDGDNSAFPPVPGQVSPGPDGSGDIEQVFHSYFASQNLASAETPFNGRSDYGPFIEAGIPAGGLFTGAEGVKTAAQAQLFGGTAGQSYDPCYHLACDSFSNVNLQGLDQMTDAIAHTVLHFSRRNFAQRPLADPPVAQPGTPGGNGGGGGLHQHHEEDEA